MIRLPGRFIPLWLLVTAWLVWQAWPQIQVALGGSAPGSQAPRLEAADLTGQPVDSDQWRNQVVLVNFWATWCPPCRRELPALEALYQQHQSRGFQVVAVATDDADAREVATIARQLGLSFPVVPARGDLARRFGATRVVPTSFLLGPQGEIIARVEGPFHGPDLEADLERLLPRP